MTGQPMMTIFAKDFDSLGSIVGINSIEMNNSQIFAVFQMRSADSCSKFYIGEIIDPVSQNTNKK